MVEGYRWAGLEPVGYLDDDVPPLTEVEGYPVLGGTEQVAEYIASKGIDEVVVALPLESYDGFFRLLGGLQQLPARVRIVPDHIKATLFRTRVEEFAGVPMITLRKPSLTVLERKVKRAFDLVFSSAMLVLTFPVMSLIAIAICLDSKGPALFRQQRVGENGRLFWMFKFRSMVEHAERQQAEAFRFTDDGHLVHKRRDDPRVTRVGGFLRRTSLDELPQLLNVWTGDMSMVGPRPELPWLVEEHYQPWQWQRFSVPQGMTGWWQVNGRSDKPMHLHTEEDLFYIQHYSFILDIQILWRTIGAVLKSRGAY
jgi:exopolysaccharide biosynthesis polyprenyl glycosylphosphotransferase